MYIRATDQYGVNWNTTNIVDSTGDVGQCPSLAIVNNLPCISYYDATNRNIKYACGTDANSIGTIVVAAKKLANPGYTRLQETYDNIPSITFYNSFSKRLLHIRATDLTGTIWPSMWVDGADINTYHISMHTTMGTSGNKPAIAYYDETNQNLLFSISSGNSNPTWSTPIVLDSIGDVGKYCKMTKYGSLPFIVYYDETNQRLKSITASDPNGNSWAAPIIIDTVAMTAPHLNIHGNVNGFPAVTYYNSTQKCLKYNRMTSSTVWGSPYTFGAFATSSINTDIGQWPTIEVIQITGSLSVPLITYHDATNSDIKYTCSYDASGTSWPEASRIDSRIYANGTSPPSAVGFWPSTLLVGGIPTIAYYSPTSSIVKYIRADDDRGLSWSPPYPIEIFAGEGIGGYGGFPSMQIINGNPAIAYWTGTNGTGSATGLGYRRALNSVGSSWPSKVAVENISSFITVSPRLLVLSNGDPGIAYINSGSIKFAKGSATDDNSWSIYSTAMTYQTATGQNAHDMFTSAVVGGNPAIAFVSTAAPPQIHYIRSTSADGSTWPASAQIAATPIVSGPPAVISSAFSRIFSISTVSSMPSILYSIYTSASSEYLYYARAGNVDGTGTWSQINIAAGNSITNGEACLFIVNGRPAIAFTRNINPGSTTLFYIRANDATGSSWPASPQIIMTKTQGNSYVMGVSLNVNSGGLPYITFYDPVSACLRYYISADIDGVTWNTNSVRPQWVDKTIGSGMYASSAVSSVYPWVTYYNSTSGTIKANKAFIDEFSANSSSDIITWTPTSSFETSVSGISDFGSATSMIANGSNIFITYSDKIGKVLKLATRPDDTSSAWTTKSLASIHVDVGSLQIGFNSGNIPVIAYQSQETNFIRLLSSNDTLGNVWPYDENAQILTENVDSGKSSWVSLINGNLACSYTDDTNNNLMYIRALNSIGNSWPISGTIVDSTLNSIGDGIMIAIINGCPAIIYRNEGNLVMKFVRSADSDGTSWNLPVTIDATRSLNTSGFYLDEQINGKPIIIYYNGQEEIVSYPSNDISLHYIAMTQPII
jgi:hypothetical protein